MRLPFSCNLLNYIIVVLLTDLEYSDAEVCGNTGKGCTAFTQSPEVKANPTSLKLAVQNNCHKLWRFDEILP